MKISDNNKWAHNYSLMWYGAYMGISLLLIFMLPFPYDFISVLGLLVLVNYVRYRNVTKIRVQAEQKICMIQFRQVWIAVQKYH